MTARSPTMLAIRDTRFGLSSADGGMTVGL